MSLVPNESAAVNTAVRFQTNSPSPQLQAALDLARRGFRVFPLQPNGKTPAGCSEDFPNRATAQSQRIIEWWRDPVFKQDLGFNPGIATGRGLIVVDVDTKDGKPGAQSFHNLFAKHPTADVKTYVVRTPSGGFHGYFTTPPDIHIPNSASKLAPGIDIRGEGGYVVGEGATTEKGRYEHVVDTASQPRPAPEWLLELIAAPRPSQSQQSETLVEPDSAAATARAVEWLKDYAPEAIEGAGGNDTTFRVAAKMRDFGLSAEGAFDALSEHWNEQKASPPWMPDELERVVNNAYSYGQNPIGSTSPEAEFEQVEIAPRSVAGIPTSIEQPKPVAPRLSITATELQPFKYGTLPQRRWVVDGLACRRYVTCIVAPGGVGKTQLITNVAAAVATNRQDVLGAAIREQTAVWWWNQEDDYDEMRRRMAATLQHFGIGFGDVAGRLHLDSGVDSPFMLARRADNRVVVSKDLEPVIQEIKRKKIGLFIVDPLVEFHEAEENDNVQMRQVVGYLRRIATESDCAVMFAAHSRKHDKSSSEGHVGDAESLRGASSQIGVVRLGWTLYGISEKDAKHYGVRESDRHLYLRLDGGKSNLTLLDGQPRFFKRVSVFLGGPGGENVGALEPVRLEKRVRGEANHVEVFASTVLTKLRPNHWHRFSTVCDELPDGETREMFRNKNNRSRAIKTVFDGQAEHSTNSGKLLFRAGHRAGSHLNLLTAPSSDENEHEPNTNELPDGVEGDDQ